MVIGVVVAVVVVLVGVLVVGRRRTTEASSVHSYRQTLSTLEQLQGRPRNHSQAAGVGNRPLRPRPARRSLTVMDHGPRRLGAPVLAVAIVAVVVGVLLYVGAKPHHATPPASASHTTDTTTTRTTQQTTTTTSQPARYTAVSSTTSSATYAPATTSYTLTVGASSGNCWMDVTSASGTTVLAQSLTAGTTHPLTLSGKATILIGAPTVAVLEIDNVPAVLPAGAGAPFTVTIIPGG